MLRKLLVEAVQLKGYCCYREGIARHHAPHTALAFESPASQPQFQVRQPVLLLHSASLIAASAADKTLVQ